MIYQLMKLNYDMEYFWLVNFATIFCEVDMSDLYDLCTI